MPFSFFNIYLFLQLTQIEDSSNYFDEAGFVYSSNNSKAQKNLYFRCKYSNQYKCNARAIVKGDDLNNATLTQKHTHSVIKTDLCKSKLDKKIGNQVEVKRHKKSILN